MGLSGLYGGVISLVSSYRPPPSPCAGTAVCWWVDLVPKVLPTFLKNEIIKYPVSWDVHLILYRWVDHAATHATRHPDLTLPGSEPRSARVRSGYTHHFYAERSVERFAVTPCRFREKLVTTHNVSLRIRGDPGPWGFTSRLHGSVAAVV